jgi:hypothetical protein
MVLLAFSLLFSNHVLDGSIISHGLVGFAQKGEETVEYSER